MREPEDAEAITQQICKMLEQSAGHSKVCLVVDNAEDVMDSHGQDVKSPSCAHHNVICIVSRSEACFTAFSLFIRSLWNQLLKCHKTASVIIVGQTALLCDV